MQRSALCLLACCAVAAQTAPNPYDSVLVVYWLTPQQEAEFSARDSVVSPFWDRDWSGRDSVLLVPPDNCYPDRCGFDGPDDATLVAKAAATDSGICYYVRAHDDRWTQPRTAG
jgi:hypothetical protein